MIRSASVSRLSSLNLWLPGMFPDLNFLWPFTFLLLFISPVYAKLQEMQKAVVYAAVAACHAVQSCCCPEEPRTMLWDHGGIRSGL